MSHQKLQKNRTLHWATHLTRLIFFLVILIYVLFVIMVIHWHVDKTFYDTWILKNAFQPGLNAFEISISNSGDGVPLSQLTSSMLIWLLTRTTVIVFLISVILFRATQILRSIRDLQTFYGSNIRAFRSMSLVGLGLAAVGCFNYSQLGGENMLLFTIPFAPILFSLACAVLAEVFSEGKALMDDSKSIV